ncbi:hypothetical protein HanIR_Chr14g0677301 [Helianthus annuus]|nr:hypothetical protein HanIR_Chr14g0677301 [Helianthus annuus]
MLETVRKSNWKQRTDFEALQKQKQHDQKKVRLPKKSVLHKLKYLSDPLCIFVFTFGLQPSSPVSSCTHLFFFFFFFFFF